MGLKSPTPSELDGIVGPNGDVVGARSRAEGSRSELDVIEDQWHSAVAS